MVGCVIMPDAPSIDRSHHLYGAYVVEGTVRRNKRNLAWASALPDCEIGDFRIVPLTTSQQLRAEGREMKHCVALYADLCHRGLARIFSIRDLCGHHVATASLIWREEYWHLEQVKGFMNADVIDGIETFFDGESTITEIEPTDLYFVSQSLLQSYRCAWDRQSRESFHHAGQSVGALAETTRARYSSS